jgi:SAM-dependent methyltransferase
MKDNFSSESDNYAKYRPTYPAIFFDYLNSILPSKKKAWDCGTGNGQVAYELAKTFDCVFATDISQSQINNALQADNINYSVQPAEETNFEKDQFDLIVIAQAIHWFDFERFFEEVRRTAKRGGIICAVGYGRIEVSKQIDLRITHFYQEIIGAYWDKERKYVDEHYETIPFPFNEIQAPRFVNKLQWTRERLLGYLNTWSAVNHFIKRNGYNPVDQFEHELDGYWDNGQTKEVRFPLILRIGQLTDF